MAFTSPQITAFAVEATEFPDLARRHGVSAVPKTVVSGGREVMGALPEEMFLEQVLNGPAAP